MQNEEILEFIFSRYDRPFQRETCESVGICKDKSLVCSKGMVRMGVRSSTQMKEKLLE